MGTSSIGGVIGKFVHQPRTVVAAEIDGRVHLMCIRVQHFAHGGADSPCSLNRKRVAPCHSFSTGYATRCTNNRGKRPASAMHSGIGESVHTPRHSNDSDALSQHPTVPLLYPQLTSVGIRACVTGARTRVQLPERRTKTNARTTHKHRSTLAAHDASQNAAPVSQLLGRFSEIEDLNRG